MSGDKLCKIYHNFVTEEECEEIISWIEQNKNLFVKSLQSGTKRLTTRRQRRKITYPKVVYDIQNRIIKLLNIHRFRFVPAFSDGIYLSVGFSGDACQAHKDPVYIPNHKTYHANVLLGAPYGGAAVIVDGERIELEERDLMVYPVSELEHSTTELIGNKNRYLAVFGFCIPNE